MSAHQVCHASPELAVVPVRLPRRGLRPAGRGVVGRPPVGFGVEVGGVGQDLAPTHGLGRHQNDVVVTPQASLRHPLLVDEVEGNLELVEGVAVPAHLLRALPLGVDGDAGGVAVMTNSDAGGRLMREIIITVFAEYGWPGIAPEERTVADLDAALYPRYAGRYDFPELGVITIEYVDGRLMADVPGEGRVELLPESETVFFDRDEGTEVTFTMAGDRVTGFVVEGQRAEKIE